jgi:hypothetical protein
MAIIDHAPLEITVRSMREGERFSLIIERAKDKRTISDPLRRYYFAVVATMIAEETGHSRDSIHEALKRKILGYVDERTGLEMVPSVFSDGSTLTVGEKKAFVDEVRRWAADFLNLWIPEPESAVY